MSIRRNTFYNLLGAALPLLLSLATIPFYLELIGAARYGVMAIAWLLLGYFGLFDLGLGRATAQRIAALRNSTVGEIADTFWTALILNLGLGVIGGGLIWPVANYFFANIFKIDDVLRPEVIAAVPLLILAVPVATVSGVLIGALQGKEEFFELNLASTVGTVLFQLLPLATVMLFGVDLSGLLIAAISARIFTLLILFARCWHHIFRNQPAVFVIAQAKQLLGFGGWVTVTSFISPIMVTLDRLLIGSISGAQNVTFYTVPYQLAERSTVISGALASAMFPRFASSCEQEKIRLANEGLRAMVAIMTPVIIFGILFIEPFLAWWVTPEFSQQSARVGQLVLLGFWANSLAVIPYAQLQAQGRPDLVAKCHLAEIFPYLALMYFGLNFFGMIGAASAFSFRVFVDFFLLSRLSGVVQLSISGFFVPSALVLMAFVISVFIGENKLIYAVLVLLNLLFTGFWVLKNAKDFYGVVFGNFRR